MSNFKHVHTGPYIYVKGIPTTDVLARSVHCSRCDLVCHQPFCPRCGSRIKYPVIPETCSINMLLKGAFADDYMRYPLIRKLPETECILFGGKLEQNGLTQDEKENLSHSVICKYTDQFRELYDDFITELNQHVDYAEVRFGTIEYVS